jgi:alpha/beta superfamily hydrolase
MGAPGALTFLTEDGLTLEGEIRRPDEAARGTALICHPHPLQGGSKDHPLLWAIRNDLASRGFVVLAFNFRGVMGSQGDYGGGVGELKDVRAAVGRVREEADGPTLVAGWSFGAHVALREALDDDRVAALALVGMPLVESSPPLPDLPDRDRLRSFDRPVLLVVGEADPFCPLPDLRSLARRLSNPSLVVVPGTDHFFWKREREAAVAIGAFAEGLTRPTG